MITLEELIKTEKSFKEKVETSIEKDYVIKRYNDYYQWLQDKLDEAPTVELKDSICSQKLKVIYSFIHWLDIHNIKAIEVSIEWNKKLIGRVGGYCSEYEERRKNGTLEDQTFKIKEHYVYNDLWNSKDLGTNSYCWSILQRTVSPNLIPSLIESFEHQEQSNTSETNKNVLRPGVNTQIPDDGSKYWHVEAKELMTYDECTQKGLGHHLLVFPIGHQRQNLSVGFLEPDKTKIKNDFDEKETKFLDTVFVEESLAD